MGCPFSPDAAAAAKSSLFNDLFPVSPLEVAGGLYGEGTQAIGNFAGKRSLATLSRHWAPHVGLPNAGSVRPREVTAMLDAPVYGGVPHPSSSALAHAVRRWSLPRRSLSRCCRRQRRLRRRSPMLPQPRAI